MSETGGRGTVILFFVLVGALGGVLGVVAKTLAGQDCVMRGDVLLQKSAP